MVIFFYICMCIFYRVIIWILKFYIYRKIIYYVLIKEWGFLIGLGMYGVFF